MRSRSSSAWSPTTPRAKARLRRLAVRHGLDPDRAYRLVAIAPRPESDPFPERPGIGEEELEELAGRIGHLLGSTAPGAEGVGAGHPAAGRAAAHGAHRGPRP